MGAWIEIIEAIKDHGYDNAVAPLVGAWIEILNLALSCFTASSLPLWERGLKYRRETSDNTQCGSRSPCGSVD